MDDLSGKTVEELQIIGFSDITRFVTFGGVSGIRLKPLSEIDPIELAAVREINCNKGVISIKLHDKVRALERLGEYMGLFSELNGALACLKKYGINLKCSDGRWFVEDEPEVIDLDQSQII